MKIFTVGYEGSDIDDFVEFLHQKKIQLLVDVRKNPVSRKRGFSKSRLAENLSLKKIEYLHFAALGVPSAWRKQAKAKVITRKKMFADYVKKVLPRSQEELQEILQQAKKKRLALLCYEADSADCHRSFIAQELKKKAKVNLQIVDLYFGPTAPQGRKPSLNSKKTSPTSLRQ